MRIAKHLEALADAAVERATGTASPSILRPTQDARHGDFQVNGAMGLAKKLGKKPRDLAEPIAAALRELDAVASAEVAGPGFVNLTLSDAWIGEQVAAMVRDEREGVPLAETRKKIVVDYSSPNIAKQMHVGHIRSTILGHAIVQTLRFVGHEVIGDNHLGDWGTQFGLLIAGLRRFRAGVDLDALDIAALEDVYRKASSLAKEDAAFADEARSELVKLQQGDAENHALWERFVAITRREIDAIYARLGVSFEWWKGESFYNPMLPGVVETLIEKGLAREDQGAICVFWQELEGAPKALTKLEAPFMVRKKDGGFNYGTTDIATVAHRAAEGIQQAIYLTDKRQQPHFEQLFALVAMLGYDMELTHVSFGAILGMDGTALKTRAGNVFTLAALLDEAEDRATALMMGLGHDEAFARSLAPTVGIGAVKYGDLRQNLNSDYTFDLEKMVQLSGNCAPYIQYAAARTGSVLRKGEIDEATIRPERVVIAEPTERALARKLLAFPDVVHSSAENALPHLLTDHLYDLAGAFSSFWQQCPVLDSTGETRESRLALTALTGRQLRRGLSLLGIESPERM